MSYLMKEQRISFWQDGKELAWATFPFEKTNIIGITSTFVDSSLRGQGIGGILVRKIANEAREQGWKIIPSCSFAAKWFLDNPEFHDIVYNAEL